MAHFDDAIIWMGGATRRTQRAGWEWTLACTCAAEASRRQYFLEWCGEFGARGIVLEFVDHPDGGPFSRNSREALVGAVRAAAGAGSFDWVFTHNLDTEGEYGLHPNHAEASHVVVDLAVKGIIKSAVVQFAYRKLDAAAGSPVVAPADASHVLPLDYDDLAWKAEWCVRARDVELRNPTLGGVSWLEKLGGPCPNPEAFLAGDVGLPPPFARS